MTEKDKAELKNLWKIAFGDEDEYIDGFFEYFYDPNMIITHREDGKIVAATYVIDVGHLVGADGYRKPCSMIYALATLPEYRSKGLGSQIVRKAVELFPDSLSVLCPASKSLFSYYEKLGYLNYFSVSEFNFEKNSSEGTVKKISADEYMVLREELLAGRVHIELSEKVMRYQKFSCLSTGGGLFKSEVDGIPYIAAAELLEDGTADIKEFLGPQSIMERAAQQVAATLGTSKVSLRTAPNGENVRSFVMVNPNGISLPENNNAWFGFVFD